MIAATDWMKRQAPMPGKYQDSYFWPSTVEQDTSVQCFGSRAVLLHG